MQNKNELVNEFVELTNQVGMYAEKIDGVFKTGNENFIHGLYSAMYQIAVNLLEEIRQ